MAIPDMNTLRQLLDKRFSPFEQEITGFRIIEGGHPPSDVTLLGVRLGEDIPHDFANIICTYDLGKMTIGPIVFGGRSGDYLHEVYSSNVISESHPFPWWGRDDVPRPIGLVLIAASDAFSFYLKTADGEVVASRHGNTWDHGTFKIADNFDLFFRAAIFVMLTRLPHANNSAIARKVAKEVGSAPSNVFWHDLAQ